MLAELPQGLFLVRPGGRGGAGRGIGLTRRGSAVARRTTATSRQRCLASIQCVGDCDLRRPFFPSEITREYPHSLLMLQVNRRQPGRPLEGLALGLDLCGVLGETLEHVDHVLHLGVRGACRRTAASCARQHDAQHRRGEARRAGFRPRRGCGLETVSLVRTRPPPFCNGRAAESQPGLFVLFLRQPAKRVSETRSATAQAAGKNSRNTQSRCFGDCEAPVFPSDITREYPHPLLIFTRENPHSLLILQKNTLIPF